MGFESETSALLAARNTLAAPDARNTLGAVGRMVKFMLSLTPPGVRRTICELPSMLNGSCALIWEPETSSSGMAMPFTVRQDSPSAVDIGVWLVAILVGLKLEPMTLISPPGATGLV